MSLADMDRETRENYSVVIQAKDMGGQLGGLAGTTTVNITLSDINDNPPVFDQSKSSSSPLAIMARFLSRFARLLDLKSGHLRLIPPGEKCWEERKCLPCRMM